VVPRLVLFRSIPVFERRLTQERGDVGRILCGLVKNRKQRAARLIELDRLKKPDATISSHDCFDRSMHETHSEKVIRKVATISRGGKSAE
jgi:hypothetical protein